MMPNDAKKKGEWLENIKITLIPESLTTDKIQ